ncbi:lecithin-cholesterol acyltransferase-like 1 [Iris pallida]|uniref:Lecithin-cholesterol acyltransferase-like 1 n=1 Tax=Iris pallida TaxID=29817 RepID=A0AAX6G2X4_IRIPA|nr:lecithin-cholesterol acyltransferase-like 1 [Iris pallida]
MNLSSLSVLPMALLLVHACHCRGSDVHPLVIIPGSGGNQLEARLSKEYKPSSLLCSPVGRKRRGYWFRLWFDPPSVLVPPLTHCFAERMTLYYHRDIDDYRNAPGVETRVPHFGSTEGLLYLDPNLKHITEYMAKLVNSLEQIGYENGHNLFGAPYDFRYGLAAPGHPSEVGSKYLKDLQQLIEMASLSNGGKPVILLSHSLGGLFALQLLARATPAWRAKHIAHLITLSAPWGGTVQEMLTFASGYTLGIPLVDPLSVREEQRSSESNLWLLPSPELFGSKPLVVTPSKSYSAKDMPQFLTAIGFEVGVYPYTTRLVPLVTTLPDPEVNVTCMVGCGVDTPERLVYGRGGFDEQPVMEYGDGDGTVNMVSLLWMESCMGAKVVKLPGISHTTILKDDVALKEIVKEIQSINSAVLSAAV